FDGVRMSVTASVSSGSSSTSTALENYMVALPHQRFFAVKTDDVRAQASLIFLATSAVLLILGAIVPRTRRLVPLRRPSIRRAMRGTRNTIGTVRRRVLAMVAVVLGYLVSNALLFPLGGHPFDMASEKLYAYVAAHFGPVHLYYLPNLVGITETANGVGLSEAAFPYEPI